MSINVRNYVSDDHIESPIEIATNQAKMLRDLIYQNMQYEKEIVGGTNEQ